MALDWLVPVTMPLVASASVAAIAQGSQPATATADWGQLAAVAGVVTAACSGLNAWLSRSMKLAVNEKVETVKGHMDAGFEKLRTELARKDLTEQRFHEFERRIAPLEEERRASIRRLVHREEDPPRE